MRTIGFIALVPAFFFAQAPEFTQQYAQRIGGAVDELNRIISHFDEDARRVGYERPKALALMSKNSEPLIRDQATRMSENITRRDRLQDQQQVMKEGGAFTRFATFAASYDPPLAARTWESYKFALPVSADSIALGLVGYVISLLLLLLAALPFRSHRIARA